MGRLRIFLGGLIPPFLTMLGAGATSSAGGFFRCWQEFAVVYVPFKPMLVLLE